MYPKIVLFGDSITEFGSRTPYGIVSRLMNTYARKADILTRGLSGYNTAMAKPYLEPFLGEINSEILALVIFFGTNDAASPTHKQHVSLGEYAANLTAMVELAQKHTQLVIITGPTVIDELSTERGVRTNERSVEYSKAAAVVAQETGSRFIDLYEAFRKRNGESRYLETPVSGQMSYKGPKSVHHLVPDGIHFSDFAYTIWYDELLEVLKSENFGPDTLRYVIPEYRKVLGLPPKQ